jgi:hypothetical protein
MSCFPACADGRAGVEPRVLFESLSTESRQWQSGAMEPRPSKTLQNCPELRCNNRSNRINSRKKWFWT